MKKNVKITANEQEKQILQDALNSSENEHLDLYKAILGGLAGTTCDVIGKNNLSKEPYADSSTFLRSISTL